MKQKKGYVALIMTLIISFLLITVVLTVSTSTLIKLPMISRMQESNEIKQILYSCVEDSLLYLNEKGELPSTINIDENICGVALVLNLDPNWEYDVNISKNSYIYKVRVKSRRSDKVYLDSLTFIDE